MEPRPMVLEKFDDEHHMKFSNDRVKEYGGFKIVATDPYGHWHVEPVKGPCPDVMAGEWTDLTKLYARIDNYNANKMAAKAPLDNNTKKSRIAYEGTAGGAG